jgi:hypothetical protein
MPRSSPLPPLWWRLLFILSSTIGFVPVSRHRINRKQVFLLGQRQRWLRQVLALGTVPLPGAIGVLAKNNENAAAADAVASARNEKAKRNVLRPAPAAQTVLLLSLQHPEHTGRFSKTVADVWRWKDAVLGDGRDFFIPRPKTLAALQRYLQAYVVDEPKIDKVVVLSNCARLELLVVIGSSRCDNNNKNQEDDEESQIRGGDGTSPSSCSLLLESISNALIRQVQHVQSLRFGPPPLDWPASIIAEQDPRPATSTRSSSSNHVDHNSSDMDRAMVQELARHWQTYDTMPAILAHWCHIAAGMAGRPNRPDRQSNDTNNNICFRPFSSRDAHIMLQMKRLVTGDDNATKWIVDTTLAAGKAARSNAIVRAQRPLLLDSTQPLPRIVAQQVQEQVLTPLIDRALLQWQAKSASGMIQQWRQRALALAQSDEERYWIQRSPLLHKATMALRRQAHHHHDDDAHDVVNVFLKDLEERLETQRKESIG